MTYSEFLERDRVEIDSEIMGFFDELINNAENEFSKSKYNYTKEFIKSGKRLRPILLLSVYRSVIPDYGKKILRPSISVELLHNSSLIHDDIIDEDSRRRSKDSFHVSMQNEYLNKSKEQQYIGSIFSKKSTRFGVSTAINSSAELCSLGASCLINSNFSNELKLMVLDSYIKTIVVLNHGEDLEILMESSRPSEREYLEMINKKTASLFCTSAEIGAVLGGADESKLEALRKYASAIGLAFQTRDDLLDISKEKGNTFGSDIKKGKNTLLVIKSLESNEDKVLSDILGKHNADDEEIDYVIEMFRKTGAIEYAQRFVEDKIKEAEEALGTKKFNADGLIELFDIAAYLREPIKV